MTVPVLVTGASGFIGRRLVARLAAGGHGVIALIPPGDEAPPGAAEVRVADLTDPRAVAEAAGGAMRVVHLAALVGDAGPEERHRRVTVGGTAHVLAALPAGARFVLASSVVVYGDAAGEGPCDEDRPLGRALGPYSRAKQAQEQLARAYAGPRGLELAVVRPTNVWGEGSGPWVRDLLREAARGRPLLIDGGEHDAGLCHVDNAVDVLVRALTHPGGAGGTFNVCDGEGITWRRYLTDLTAAAGIPLPGSLDRRVAAVAARACELVWWAGRFPGRPPITREALNLVGSDFRVPLARARDQLGHARVTSYRDGMRALASWVHERRGSW